MLRRIHMGASLRWALVICVTCFFAVGCSGNSSRNSRSPGVNLTGVVDDGGPNSPVPRASCVFINDTGPVVGPVIAGLDGRFTLKVPLNATGRIQCTPLGMIDLMLVIRVAARTTDQNIGTVDPESSLIAGILEMEIDEGTLNPTQVANRTLELENDEDLGTVVDAVNIVVDALLTAGLDADLLDVVLDLYDNGLLDDPGFAAVADDVNDQLMAEIDIDDLVAVLDEFADLFFGELSILTDGKVLVEHNSTDEDTGFQSFVDGDPWNRLDIADPSGVGIVTVNALGGLRDFGLTELFFETSEPPNNEVPIEDVLARLDEAKYSFTGDQVAGDDRTRFTEFTHDIPAGPVLLTPPDGSTGMSPNNLLVSWELVTEDIDGDPLEIVGYQVIVEEDAPLEFPQGFSAPVFSVYLPGSATQVTVPNGFLKADGCYAYEVLAIEETGNQTLSSAAFETGDGCGGAPLNRGTNVLTKARLLIEHNSTDEDTGFQCFADGDPWNTLTVTGPGGVDIVVANARGGLFDFGLTEFFFETSEPLNDEVPIPNVLARVPEGMYTFFGEMVSGGISTLIAEVTHKIPAGAVLLTPPDGARNVDPTNTVVSWEPVTTDVNGDPAIVIVGYQVIVELDAAPEFPKGFLRPVLSIYLPDSATQIQVPAELMVTGADYKYEVLAIELSGNQTLASGEFTTR